MGALEETPGQGRWEGLPQAWQRNSRNSLFEEIRLHMKNRQEALPSYPGLGSLRARSLALFYHSRVTRVSGATGPFFLPFDSTREVSISL